jgi:hypothetical protein
VLVYDGRTETHHRRIAGRAMLTAFMRQIGPYRRRPGHLNGLSADIADISVSTRISSGGADLQAGGRCTAFRARTMTYDDGDFTECIQRRDSRP